ncbi:hypothetical protein LJC42_05565 [Eubacteriales bacterium OttesenSCG-928-K08]|nr:hypothetical protein [Eubacteriales bacterium OttesenSCG-928-K08]
MNNTLTKTAQRQNTSSPELVKYGILSCALIPLYTLLFASKGGLLASNLSKTGNLPGNQIWFILWGVVCAGYFHIFSTRVYEFAGFKSKVTKPMMSAACALLTLTVLFPFLPDQYPICAQLHDTSAKLAVALSVFTTLIFSLDLKHVNPAASGKAVALWVWHFVLCLYLLLRTGTSGLTESMFIITTSIQLFVIMHWACEE